MEIAPSVDAARWHALKLDDSAGRDWAEAIRILETRIHERFIDPIDHLIAAEEAKAPLERRFGFVILAVDCLLVETLGAFREGLETTDGSSKATFCRFLTTGRLLSREFKTWDVARRFYEDFRCGILQQAEVGGESKVWSVGPLLQDNGCRIIVNRTQFHELLKAEFQAYLGELRDSANAELRRNFSQENGFHKPGVRPSPVVQSKRR
jgi:hypothetical protein